MELVISHNHQQQKKTLQKKDTKAAVLQNEKAVQFHTSIYV